MSAFRPGSPEFRHIPLQDQQAFHHDDYRRGMPPLPDLSFERTYIKSIRRHVHADLPRTDRKELSTIQRPEAENIRLDWGKIALVTIKDQMFMPFLQGALWGLTTIFIFPRLASARRACALWWRRGNLIGIGRKKEGEGIGALRNWLSNLTVNHNPQPSVAVSRHAI
ncbi:hypothetical protein BDY19DRAFT_992575 [Irpex rosettiformis]|uniref:Uncharacterized protein n=1 Tax=Irpex rosettiformis TaxID=378272 RepID=A0ACB8U7T8_9APHY|nr:hypothetical protein BDY19DRAFT_992575 [Irpex rosettiformis]